MCRVQSNNQTFYMGADDAPRLSPVPRRVFIHNAALARSAINNWFVTLNGGIPLHIFTLLMFSDYETFVSPLINGLKVGNFISILYFFEANDAPVSVRKIFWRWVFGEPVVADGELLPSDHPYLYPYNLLAMASRNSSYMPYFRRVGAFLNVETGVNQLIPLWAAYNVWGARGAYAPETYNPDRAGRRVVGVNLVLADGRQEASFLDDDLSVN